MVSVPVQCPYCHSTEVIKAGSNQRDQRDRCHNDRCARRIFLLQYQDRGRVPEICRQRVRALLTVDARESLRRCRPPVLYLASSHDQVVPPHNVAEIVHIRPSVQVRTIAGYHLALYTNPAAAASAICEFLAQGVAG
jgi:pimeloyl-ACP methyl ester carboxylesterase